MPGKISVLKIWAKILPPNQIIGFFDQMNISADDVSVFSIFPGDIHQWEVACEIATFGWVCPRMSNHA